jgi:hypothetical protein
MRSEPLDEHVDDGAQLLAPRSDRLRRLHPRKKGVSDRVKELFLVRHVPVESHRCHAELLRDAPNRHRLETLAIDDFEGLLDDRGAAQLDGRRGLHGNHLDNYTP